MTSNQRVRKMKTPASSNFFLQSGFEEDHRKQRYKLFTIQELEMIANQ